MKSGATSGFRLSTLEVIYEEEAETTVKKAVPGRTLGTDLRPPPKVIVGEEAPPLSPRQQAAVYGAIQRNTSTYRLQLAEILEEMQESGFFDEYETEIAECEEKFDRQTLARLILKVLRPAMLEEESIIDVWEERCSTIFRVFFKPGEDPELFLKEKRKEILGSKRPEYLAIAKGVRQLLVEGVIVNMQEVIQREEKADAEREEESFDLGLEAYEQVDEKILELQQLAAKIERTTEKIDQVKEEMILNHRQMGDLKGQYKDFTGKL